MWGKEANIYGDNPGKRFGHTINMISENKAILFGGALGINNIRISNDTFLLDCNKNKWTKIKPKNDSEAPCARAAHSACSVDTNQIVIFGGANSQNIKVDNELYLLRYKQDDFYWTKININGPKPSTRYGHSSVYFQNYILIIGGNIGMEPCNEVWSLYIKNSPFEWKLINFPNSKDKIPARAYHSNCLWTNNKTNDMILVFGGRTINSQPLNDVWGLRKHNNGEWDWTKAVYKNKYPESRYQHSMFCFQNLLFITGGRNDRNEVLNLSVFDLNTFKWIDITPIQRFRQVSWVYNNKFFIHGGFDTMNPNISLDTVYYYDLIEIFKQFPELNIDVENFETNIDENYKISNNIEIYLIYNDNLEKKNIDFNKLNSESLKLVNGEIKITEIEEKINSLFKHIKENLYDINKFKEYNYYKFPIEKQNILNLCNIALHYIKGTENIIYLRSSVKIFGSIHGQYEDLLRLFKHHGSPESSSNNKSDIDGLDYLFLGNYVDRGKYSLEVIIMLLALKIKKPKLIHLLRGSHEDRNINFQEGLAFECSKRLSENINEPNSVYNKINEIFEYLPLCAILDKKIFCVSSGIGLNTNLIEDIKKIPRPIKILSPKDVNSKNNNHNKILIDLLWSDPVVDINDSNNQVNENRNYYGNIRFGTERIKKFLNDNKMELIIRSHESVMDGFEKFGNTNLYTIFSCTNYGGIFKNKAANLIFTRRNTVKAKQIDPHPNSDPSNYWIIDNNNNNNNKNNTNTRDYRAVTPPRNYNKKRNF